MAKTDWDDSPSDLLRARAGFDLASIDPNGTPGFGGGKSDGRAALKGEGDRLAELQEQLWAESRSGGARSVLLVLQAMDTAGKGGIVRNVVGAMDPLGLHVTAFKAPTPAERRHDFLWRIRNRLPEAGYVGIFDRSHYEDVLIHRVRGLSAPEVIEERYGLIREFEAEVAASGTTIVKVMLHISADEQKARLAERLERPDKHWKFSLGDLDERALWPDYQEAYQLAIEHTSTPDAPWFVVPGNRKWYARLAVQHLLIDAFRGLDLKWPVADFDVAEAKERLALS
ncbi:PPK2 family polyphosphate:nucleotide phosphotransferase [Marisediminicola sp. UYEF4]|uniref:PPK2 family polyphosphate kinase n=1 Tax=Marisediminicola sp. UYEF4 TaxID=1756384 RepID=UPI0033949B12